MIDETIQNYLVAFNEASGKGRFGDVVKLLDELKSQFRARRASPTEIVCRLNGIAMGKFPPGSSLVFVAAWYSLSTEYQEPLCRILLSEGCREFHEAAVELLVEVGDSKAIPALEKSLEYRWDYDPWLNVPRKALQALWAIRTNKSVDLVKMAAGSAEKLISDEARSLLTTKDG